MLINDMQKYTLQKQTEVKTKSGQKKKDWIDIESIKVAIYLIDEMSVVGSVRYDTYDFAGFTFYTLFDRNVKYRIFGSETYTIERAVKKGCTTHLLLKRVEV